MRDNSSHIVIIFLLTLITLNLFLLDLKVFSPENNIKISDITSVVTPIPSITTNYPLRLSEASQLQTNNLFCPNSCIVAIQQATSSAIERIGTNHPPTTNYQPLTPREFYIPLGSGSTTKSDFEDITSTDAIIDPANYGNIKDAYFISSLRNPTQNGAVEAQLYNVTDKHLVWGSQLTINGPAVQTVTSDKITLDKGAKLYRVRLKSTLGFAVSLDNAKIRIVTQ